MKVFLTKLLSLFNNPITRHLLYKLLFITLVIKLITVFYLSYLWAFTNSEAAQYRIAIRGGDDFSYIGAMDNFIEEGEFYFIKQENENVRKHQKAYAGRMPYYGIPYYVLRTLVPKEQAADFMVIFQVFFESLSIVVFSLVVYKAAKTVFAFWASYFILILNLTISTWSVFLMTESLSISFSIFFLYYYQCYLSDTNRSYNTLLISGFFAALLVLLKAYFILLYLIIGLEFLWYKRKEINIHSIADITKRTFIVSSILIVFLLPWTVRNYRLLNKFIPLQSGMDAGYGFSRSFVACSNFIKAWGGNMIYWDYSAAGSYFIPAYTPSHLSFTFPDYAFSKSYSLEDIEDIRNKYLVLQSNYSDSLDIQVAKAFDQLTELYKKERSFRYYFISPLILTKKFILTAPSYYLPINPSFDGYKRYQFLILKSQSALYYFLLVFGSIGLVYLVKKDQNNFIFLAIPFMLLILFPVSLRLIEGRYLINIYPFLVAGTVAILNYIIETFYSKKATLNNNL